MAVVLLGTAARAQNRDEYKEMKKKLVAYFSATRTTRAAAQRLAKEKRSRPFRNRPGRPLHLGRPRLARQAVPLLT